MSIVDDDHELVRQQSFTSDAPADLDVSITAGRVTVELSDSTEVTVSIRRDPAGSTAGPVGDLPGFPGIPGLEGLPKLAGLAGLPVLSSLPGLSGLFNWLGAAAQTAGDPPTGGPDRVAAAVEAAEIEWSDAGRRLVVRSPAGLQLRSVPLLVTVSGPTGSRARLRTGSGAVQLRGAAGDTEVRTGSGDVHIDTVGGTAEVRAGSGEVRLGTVLADVSARTGSGDLTVSDARHGLLELVTGSGRLQVAVHAGVAAELDLSSGAGCARSELEVQATTPTQRPTLVVRGRTGTGDMLVTRAAS